MSAQILKFPVSKQSFVRLVRSKRKEARKMTDEVSKDRREFAEWVADRIGGVIV